MTMLKPLATEQRNDRTMHLDQMKVEDLLHVMNDEDQSVPLAIKRQIPVITEVVKQTIASFQRGGRLIYLGAGTSGRLGVMDAAECVTTFGVSPDRVMGIIAGGDAALAGVVEHVEDQKDAGKDDLRAIRLQSSDIVIGIAASGRTPYVIGALKYAQDVGATTVAFSCNTHAAMSQRADLKIEVETGPEVLTGSTRLKAGTAQKLVLNMISTASMVGLGKVYENLMVDVQPMNEKLKLRARRIIAEATGVGEEEAGMYFEQAHGKVKVAIVMILTGVSYPDAIARLDRADGFVRDAL